MPVLGFDDEEIARAEEILDAEGTGYVEALGELPAAEREAVHARVLEERAYSEIATAHGTSQQAIRQRVSRGLAKLGRTGREGK